MFTWVLHESVLSILGTLLTEYTVWRGHHWLQRRGRPSSGLVIINSYSLNIVRILMCYGWPDPLLWGTYRSFCGDVFVLHFFHQGFFSERKISAWIMIPRWNKVPDGHRLYLLRDILNIFGSKFICFSFVLTNNKLNVWAVVWMICSIVAEGLLSQNIILDQVVYRVIE